MPAPPLPERLSEALERFETAYTVAVADGQLTTAERARLERLWRSVRVLWVHQEAGIRLARVALGYGGGSTHLRRLEREYREDLPDLDAA